jgi:hypothetical protein
VDTAGIRRDRCYRRGYVPHHLTWATRANRCYGGDPVVIYASIRQANDHSRNSSVGVSFCTRPHAYASRGPHTSYTRAARKIAAGDRHSLVQGSPRTARFRPDTRPMNIRSDRFPDALGSTSHQPPSADRSAHRSVDDDSFTRGLVTLACRRTNFN